MKTILYMIGLVLMITLTTGMTIESGVFINTSGDYTAINSSTEWNAEQIIINATAINLTGANTTNTNAYNYNDNTYEENYDVTYWQNETFNMSEFISYFGWQDTNNNIINNVKFGNLTAQGQYLQIYTLSINNGTYTWETSELPDGFSQANYTFYINYTNYTNYTYTAESLNIQFNFEQNGTEINTTGILADSNSTNCDAQDQGGCIANFNETSFFNYTTNIGNGLVKLYFGQIENQNYTQQYQFIKTPNTNINETLNVLISTAGTMQVQVTDFGGEPIEDATVRVFSDDSWWYNFGWENLSLIGQYITDNNGYTDPIYTDLGSIMSLEVTADGYSVEKTAAFKAVDYDGLNYLTKLRKSTSIKLGTTHVAIQNRYYNESQNIYGYVYAPGSSTVGIQTTYRNDNVNTDTQNLTEVDLNGLETNDIYAITLEPSVHFSNTNPEDINMTIYVDNIDVGNIIITYYNETNVEILPTSDIEDIPMGAILAFIIIATLMTGFIFKSQNAGQIGFVGSTIIAGIINPLFFILIVIIILRYGIIQIRKVRQED